MDVDARIQLFDLKTLYRFQTTSGIDKYNMPIYSLQTEPGSQTISYYPVYQGFMDPCWVNGIQVPFYSQQDAFWNVFPNYVQPQTQVDTGDGSTTTFSFDLPFFPAIPGHVDLTGMVANGSTADPIFTNSFITTIPATSVYSGVYITYTNSNGSNVVIADSGQFLQNGTGGDLYGLLMQVGNPPFGNSSLGSYSTTVNTVNYNTGAVNVTFPTAPPNGTPIQVQCYFYEQGIPRGILFYNNTITIRPPPDVQYLAELTAYLTPAAFLTTSQAVQFAYMSEYIARGAARKILADTGDVEQFTFYEPLFREQEMLVWKRSQRQFTSTRTNTIFSQLTNQSSGYNVGQGT